MWKNQQDNNQIINLLKNELVSVKSENYTDHFQQQTCINYESETKQNVYGGNRIRRSVPKKYFKGSKIGRSLNSKNNKQDAINGIVICAVCGNLYTNQIEYFYHYSIHHSLRKKKLLKIKFNRRDTGILINLNQDVKYDVKIVEHELKEELVETKNCAQFKSIDHYKPHSCQIVENAKSGGNACKKRFICDICFKFFPMMKQLNRHKLNHRSEKTFKCEICAKAFSLKSNLNIHIRSHNGRKLFKCDICSKSFTQRGNLMTHSCYHKGELLKCDICLKEFSRKYHLNTHMRNHTGDKPFKCDICLKYFARQWGLNRHLRCHTEEKPFKCDICLKYFAQRSQLIAHSRYHTGEKPFKCDICWKSFSQKGRLQEHLCFHSGDKPFKCDRCSKYFARKFELNRHLLTLSHQRKTVPM